MRRKLGTVTAIAFVAAIVGAANAQPAAAPATGVVKPPAKRTILQKADVAASPAQETLMGTVDIPVGAGNPRHTHNGIEIGYVVEGRLRQEVDGQPPRILGPGDSFLILRGVPHQSFLLGDKPVRLVSTWVVDKGGELMIPVK